MRKPTVSKFAAMSVGDDEMIDVIGLPILLAALLGFAIFGGDDGNSGSGTKGDSGGGFKPSDEDDEGYLTNDDDTVDLLAGDDKVYGRDGGDEIRGNAGDDTVIGENGDDILHGGAGDDIVYGGAGDDTISDNSGDNGLFGGDGDDVITTVDSAGQIGGGDGDDLIDTTDSDVTIVAGAGADTVTVDGGEGVKAFGGDGADLIHVADSDGALVNGGNGQDTLSNVGGRLDGSNGDDVIGSYQDGEGQRYNNLDDDGIDIDPRTAMYGGAGDDIIMAIEGNNALFGGDGADEFHNQARSTIEDFEPGTDKLVIDLLYDKDEGDADVSDYDIILTEIEINGVASTLVETRVAVNAGDTVAIENLDQNVWIKGVTPDQIADDDIDVAVIETTANDDANASIFAGEIRSVATL